MSIIDQIKPPAARKCSSECETAGAMLAEEARALMAGGMSIRGAASELGMSKSALQRVLSGQAGGGKRRGRPALAVLSDAEAEAARALVAKGMSEVMALRVLAAQGRLGPEASEAVAAPRKSKHSIPPAMRRQIKVPQSLRDYANGPRRFELRQMTTPRGLDQIIDGERSRIEPGDWFVFDDMTANFGWWRENPHGASASAKAYGVEVTRGQLLAGLDYASLAFLDFELLSREGESYRSADVWAMMGKMFRGTGMPRRGVVLEGGIWQGKDLHGVKLNRLGRETREEMVDPEKPVPDLSRIGGLRHLGVRAHRSWGPKTKPIEGRFDFLQGMMEGIPGNLGRFRDQEREHRNFVRCKMGYADPRDHLPHQSEMAESIARAMEACNSEPVEGRHIRGIPRALFEAACAAAPLSRVPREMGWIFARDKRVVTLPANGMVKLSGTTTGGAWTRYFRAPELSMIPVANPSLLVLFDPLETDGDAYILNADLKSWEQDGRTIRRGDFVCVAGQMAESPAIVVGGGYKDGNIATRKEIRDAVRGEYRSLGLGGGVARRIAEHYDGQGRAARVEAEGEAAAVTSRPARPAPQPEQALPVRTPRRAGLAGLSGLSLPDDHDAAMEFVRRAAEASLAG